MRPLPAQVRGPLHWYRALFPLVFIALLPGFALRIWKRGGYRNGFGQRLGLYDATTRDRLARLTGPLWVHAVSVGEMMMALKLIEAIRADAPETRIVLSTTTSTGYALARDRAGEGVEVIYYPLDATPIIRRVLALIRPAQLALIDKEFWPNMVVECYRRGIPVSILNARLSQRSERRFLRWKGWCGPFFGLLHRVGVQEIADAPRWERLGVRQEALVITGSLKYDEAGVDVTTLREKAATLAKEIASLGDAWGEERMLLLGGSTFPGEEALLARVWLGLRERFPALRLILVPRHVERCPQLEGELQAIGVRIVRRSALPMPGADPQVLLVDTTGELAAWYQLATLSVIGKSFGLSPKGEGGQNPVEALQGGSGVICGPLMGNFSALMASFRAVDGVQVVGDEAELQTAIATSLEAPSALARRNAAALAVLDQHRGAIRRSVELLLTPVNAPQA